MTAGGTSDGHCLGGAAAELPGGRSVERPRRGWVSAGRRAEVGGRRGAGRLAAAGLGSGGPGAAFLGPLRPFLPFPPAARPAAGLRPRLASRGAAGPVLRPSPEVPLYRGCGLGAGPAAPARLPGVGPGKGPPSGRGGRGSSLPREPSGPRARTGQRLVRKKPKLFSA